MTGAQRNIIDFVSAPDLLGPYFAGPSWGCWRAVLKAAFALPLDRAERRLFRALAGHRKPPSHPVRELTAIVGRGGGKGFGRGCAGRLRRFDWRFQAAASR